MKTRDNKTTAPHFPPRTPPPSPPPSKKKKKKKEKKKKESKNKTPRCEDEKEASLGEGGPVPQTPAAQHLLQLLAEGWVHEGVDDGVGHVVGEVAIEDDGVEAHDPVGHEPGGQEGQDEDESHHEEHQRRSDVGQQVLLLQGRVALQHGASLLARHLRHLEAVLQRRLGRHDAVRVRHGHVAEQPQVGLLPRSQPLGPSHENGAVDGDVEEEDDDEADEEHGGVDLLVGLAEEGGEDDLVEAALARVDHRLLLRHQALGDASRRQGVHHGDGGVAGVLLTVRAGDRPRDTF